MLIATRFGNVTQAHLVKFPGGARTQLTFYPDRQKIRGVGTTVWYLMAKDEGHGFAKKSSRDFQFYATMLFAKQYLLN